MPLDVAPLPDPTLAELLAARPHLRMHAHDGLLLEEVPLWRVAREAGTPCWVYGAGTLRARLARLRAALEGLPAHVHYAVKANDHLAVLRVLAREGCGADVVSGGELLRALHAGVAPADVVFSGVGKTAAELRLAAERGVGQVNAESAAELDMLSAAAVACGRTTRVALRANPDVDAGTHSKITTGRRGNKFGVAWEDVPGLYARAAALPGLRPVGVALHIGSQITSMAPYRAAWGRAAEMVGALRAAGHAVEVVDCGGGLGIRYRDEPEGSPEALAGALRATLGGLGVRLMLEPGRWLVGPAGVLLASVVLEKRAGTRFVVLDAAMTELLRPAMYEAWHGIVPVSPCDALGTPEPADVVGPVCESADTFARARALPPLAPGALVAMLDAGAYGAVMSSPYNSRPPAAQVLVDGAQMSVIRARPAPETLWADERVPEWLA